MYLSLDVWASFFSIFITGAGFSITVSTFMAWSAAHLFLLLSSLVRVVIAWSDLAILKSASAAAMRTLADESVSRSVRRSYTLEACLAKTIQPVAAQ